MVERDSFAMDTVIRISLYNWEKEETLTLAMSEINRLEGLLSVEQEGSDLYKLAQAAGEDWVDISPETQELLSKAKDYWQLSEGHFDVTIGPLVNLWNIRDGTGHVPSQDELTQACSLVDAEKLLLEDGRAFLSEKGMEANLGGIAKGYIADKVKELLLAEGVEYALINLGGNILLIGGKDADTPFHVGVEKPETEEGLLPGRIEARDKSIVTAGITQRFFMENGIRYHHILDPFTGYPADTGLVCVTIVSNNSVDGDALSTTCLLLGAEKGMELIESIPDTEALFQTVDGDLLLSSGASAYYHE